MKKKLFSLAALGGCILLTSCSHYEIIIETGQQTSVDNVNNNVQNGHAYVNLGLPSGTLWATCNIGAEKPEDYGNYYAWGETKAYGEKDTSNEKNYSYAGSYTKTIYNWDTYKYCNGSYNSLTKYCTNSRIGIVDNKTELELSDDVARANWGSDWRMPTPSECQELLDNTTMEWTTQNGVKGYKFTASNGNYIFLPAAGDRLNNNWNDSAIWGMYLSSTLYQYNDEYVSECATTMKFSSACLPTVGKTMRSTGISVRAVR